METGNTNPPSNQESAYLSVFYCSLEYITGKLKECKMDRLGKLHYCSYGSSNEFLFMLVLSGPK